METWEYDVVSVARFTPAQAGEEAAFLSTYGVQGWSLVSVVEGLAYFKRPLAPPRPPPQETR